MWRAQQQGQVCTINTSLSTDATETSVPKQGLEGATAHRPCGCQVGGGCAGAGGWGGAPGQFLGGLRLGLLLQGVPNQGPLPTRPLLLCFSSLCVVLLETSRFKRHQAGLWCHLGSWV